MKIIRRLVQWLARVTGAEIAVTKVIRETIPEVVVHTVVEKVEVPRPIPICPQSDCVSQFEAYRAHEGEWLLSDGRVVDVRNKSSELEGRVFAYPIQLGFCFSKKHPLPCVVLLRNGEIVYANTRHSDGTVSVIELSPMSLLLPGADCWVVPETEIADSTKITIGDVCRVDNHANIRGKKRIVATGYSSACNRLIIHGDKFQQWASLWSKVS